jgi:hypothetical protein
MVHTAQAELEIERLPIETIESEFHSAHVALREIRMHEEIEELKAKVNADPSLGHRLNALVKELGQIRNQRRASSA